MSKSGGIRNLAIIAGPLLFLCCALIGGDAMWRMAGIALWMAVWWMTEPFDIAVTSLVPFALLPLCGIADAKVVAASYMDPVIFLFLGGFLLSTAIEKWGLHTRFAAAILKRSGSSHTAILAGIMLPAYLISMWISNTATVMMLLAMSYALSGSSVNKSGKPTHRPIAGAIMLGLAYAANIGGMATLVGTPTNMIFYSFYQNEYPQLEPITFTRWLWVALPMSLLLLFAAFLSIKWVFKVKPDQHVHLQEMLAIKEAGGRKGFAPGIVLLVFAITALLWITRADMKIGSIAFKGWSGLLPWPGMMHDAVVAIAAAIILFLIPDGEGRGERVLNWNDVEALPFGILLLFGSGFALAKGFEITGLDKALAAKLGFLHGMPIPLIILCITTLITIISEFASNVASIQLMLPVLAAISSAMGIAPATLMIPATLAASLGFMLPVATAPNTIAYGTGFIRGREMNRAGLLVNIAGILLITLFSVLIPQP
jgi:sodium-dependent dicarboxylate transporter 2/3/5